MKQLSILMIAAVALLGSCKKDSSESVKDLLIKNKWRYQAHFENGTQQVLPGCAADDVLDFIDSGSGTYDEGATKCDPGDAQTTLFTWSLSEDQKTLFYSVAGAGSVSFSILKVDNSSLELEITINGIVSRNVYVKM